MNVVVWMSDNRCEWNSNVYCDDQHYYIKEATRKTFSELIVSCQLTMKSVGIILGIFLISLFSVTTIVSSGNL